MGERPKRLAALRGRAAGLGGGPGGGGGRIVRLDGRPGAGVATSHRLQDGNPVPLTLPLGLAWNASTPWLVVVFLS